MEYKSFIDDREKIDDLLHLSQDEFLESYSYLTREEYALTIIDIMMKLFPQKSPEPEEPAPLRVCEHCLMAIESREGQQITRKIYVDEDDPQKCDWCETDNNDVLYEIL